MASNEGHICRFVVKRRSRRRQYWPMAIRITRGCAYITINSAPWTPAALIVLECFSSERIPPSWLRYLDNDQTNIRISNLAAEPPRARVAWRGRPQALSEDIMIEAMRRYDAGETVADLAKALNVSRPTLRARLREFAWNRYKLRLLAAEMAAASSTAAKPTSENSSNTSTRPSQG